MRQTAAILFLALVFPVEAAAQDPDPLVQPPTYVIGTFLTELPSRSVTAVSGEASRVTISGGGLGLGFPLSKANIEFVGVWHSKETRAAFEGTTARTRVRTENRDVPLVTIIRFRPWCPDRLCSELYGGIGINFSRQSSVIIGNCGTVQQPAACTPANTALPNRNKEDPTAMIGLGLTTRVTRHLHISPNVGIWYVRRYADKTEDRAAQIDLRRTPGNGRLELGVTATWRLR